MTTDKQLKSLKIEPDLSGAEIVFTEMRALETPEDADPDAEGEIKSVVFKVSVPYRPHADLVNEMKKLRKHALAMLGISLEDPSKQIKKWATLELKLSGDVEMKQGRCKIRLGIENEETKKVSRIETQQMTLYPKADEKSKYHAHAEVATIVENIINEVWEYVDGKHEDGLNGQLALFHSVELVTK